MPVVAARSRLITSATPRRASRTSRTRRPAARLLLWIRRPCSRRRSPWPARPSSAVDAGAGTEPETLDRRTFESAVKLRSPSICTRKRRGPAGALGDRHRVTGPDAASATPPVAMRGRGPHSPVWGPLAPRPQAGRTGFAANGVAAPPGPANERLRDDRTSRRWTALVAMLLVAPRQRRPQRPVPTTRITSMTSRCNRIDRTALPDGHGDAHGRSRAGASWLRRKAPQ
jgi:hypothetical protein